MLLAADGARLEVARDVHSAYSDLREKQRIQFLQSFSYTDEREGEVTYSGAGGLVVCTS